MHNASRLLAVLALAALSGCASMQSIEQYGTLDNYAKCATADVASTAIGLATQRMIEGNPLVRALAIKALGPVAGVVVPVIGLSIAGYYLLQAIDRPAVTAVAAGLTCAAAARNLYLIR